VPSNRARSGGPRASDGLLPRRPHRCPEAGPGLLTQVLPQRSGEAARQLGEPRQQRRPRLGGLVLGAHRGDVALSTVTALRLRLAARVAGRRLFPLAARAAAAAARRGRGRAAARGGAGAAAGARLARRAVGVGDGRVVQQVRRQRGRQLENPLQGHGHPRAAGRARRAAAGQQRRGQHAAERAAGGGAVAQQRSDARLRQWRRGAARGAARGLVGRRVRSRACRSVCGPQLRGSNAPAVSWPSPSSADRRLLQGALRTALTAPSWAFGR
jgi:hypothetical protein